MLSTHKRSIVVAAALGVLVFALSRIDLPTWGASRPAHQVDKAGAPR